MQRAIVPHLFSTTLVPLLLGATALLGIAELAVSRTLAPTLAHLPQQVLDPRVGELAQLLGSRAFAGVAVLIVLAALAYLATATWRARPIPLLTALCVIAAAVATMIDAPAAAVLASATMMAAAAGIAAATVASARRAIALPVLAAAVSLTAARLPLLIGDLSPGGGLDAGRVAGAYSVAEASFIAVPILLALAIARGRVPGAAIVAALTVALLATLTMVGSPAYAAILSTWAVGVTLSLPLPFYIAAAGASAFVLARSAVDQRIRGLGVGLVLFAVAGAHPSLIHHNITAALALVLLSSPELMTAQTGNSAEIEVAGPRNTTEAATQLSLKEAIDG